MRVLIVDDHTDSLAWTVRALLRHGYQAIPCAHGIEAMELIETTRPDVVLLDLKMPCMNGFEVAEELALHPDLRPKLLVAVTGLASAKDQERTLAAGFDLHLVKPLQWRDLEAVLEMAASKTKKFARD